MTSLNARLPRHTALWIGFLFLLAIGAANARNASEDGLPDNLALNGHDTVAYFKQEKAVLGDPDHATTWNGLVWYFSNENNLKIFKANPEAYLPEFNGHCSWSLTEGRLEVANPECFTIQMGRLYLHFDQDVQKQFEANLDQMIVTADQNWEVLEPETDSIHQRMREMHLPEN